MYSCARRPGATVARCPWICRKGCQLLEEQQPVKLPVNCGSPVRHWFLIWPIRWQFTPLPDYFKLKSCSAKWPVVHGIIPPLVWLHYKLYRKLSDSKAILSAVYCLIPRLSYLSHGDLGLRSCTANSCNCLPHKIHWFVNQLVGPAPPPLFSLLIRLIPRLYPTYGKRKSSLVQGSLVPRPCPPTWPGYEARLPPGCVCFEQS